MNESKISVRYAKALIMSAKDHNVLDPVRADMVLLIKIIKEVPELLRLLESPVVVPEKKLEVMNAIFSGKCEPLTLSFIRLAITKKREEYLSGMARIYIDLFKKEKGIKQAFITTAVPIDKEIRTAIINMIKKVYNTEIELDDKIDKQIIGGFILQVEDQLLDASVTGQIRKIRKSLVDKTYEKR
jgi:F-type H+-transporting ATPase subunit delta